MLLGKKTNKQQNTLKCVKNLFCKKLRRKRQKRELVGKQNVVSEDVSSRGF